MLVKLHRYIGAVLLNVLLSSALSACASPVTHLPVSDMNDTMECYPYLTASGLYGYADSACHLVIPARFRSATPFSSTGFAVVENEGMNYGVINKKGELVVPFEHKAVYLQVIGGRTLLWTERAYVNRWRFWEWRFLPGFSIIGGSSDNRLFDTKVKRLHLKITVLENGQIIYTEHVPADLSYGYHFDVRALDSTHFLRGDELYELASNRAVMLAKGIFGETYGGGLLQRQAGYYRLIDSNGKPLSDTRYTWVDSLQFKVGDHPLSIPLTDNAYSDGCWASVFRDEAGKQYVFPDFGKAFPSRVDALMDDSSIADTLLNKAITVSGMSGTGRFIFRWYNRYVDKFQHPMVDLDGHWHTDIPPNNTFTMVTSGLEHIVWPPAASVIPVDAVPTGWKIGSYAQVRAGCHLYEVTIYREGTERMGIWDADAHRWLWPPDNYYICCLDLSRGYWTFRPEKEGKCGLYHLPSKRVLIQPKYHDMSANGMVVFYDEDQRYKRFYVDWEMQREFRD